MTVTSLKHVTEYDTLNICHKTYNISLFTLTWMKQLCEGITCEMSKNDVPWHQCRCHWCVINVTLLSTVAHGIIAFCCHYLFYSFTILFTHPVILPSFQNRFCLSKKTGQHKNVVRTFEDSHQPNSSKHIIDISIYPNKRFSSTFAKIRGVASSFWAHWQMALYPLKMSCSGVSTTT